MFILKSSINLNNLISKLKIGDHKIGFVATMGALHKGHLSLIQRSKKENDTTVCSIFVNPRQFNDIRDLEKYPRPIEHDISLLINSGCDILFLPEVEEIYPPDYEEQEFNIFKLESILEGNIRPGHFKGVAQVVKRLFDCVKPDRAYFGQKDYQQTLIIKQIVNQFKLPIEIVITEIIREESGLAMSSRNARLSTENREKAGFIYEILLELKSNVKVLELAKAIDIAKNEILKQSGAKLEYFEITDSETLLPLDNIKSSHKAIGLMAVNYYGVRLLDNIFV